MQITCISAEMLKKAYEAPDAYKNLVVRVGGCSEYFYRLNDDLKCMVIGRTVQSKRQNRQRGLLTELPIYRLNYFIIPVEVSF